MTAVGRFIVGHRGTLFGMIAAVSMLYGLFFVYINWGWVGLGCVLITLIGVFLIVTVIMAHADDINLDGFGTVIFGAIVVLIFSLLAYQVGCRSTINWDIYRFR